VTGPFFSTLGTVYGIFLAFIVSTIWQQYSGTSTNLVQEARYLSNLYFSTKSFDQPYQAQIQQLLRSYRDSVVNDEWKSMARGEANPNSEKILGQIADAYMQCKVAEGFDKSFLTLSIEDFSRMKGLRASRLDDSASGLQPTFWLVLILGASVTVGFTFLFGAHNFKAQAVMTMLLTGVICMSIFMILALDFPFTGVEAIPPDPLMKLKME
jgi:hypothetical protein